mmetsp:Transcript_37692/g.65941  ORF Transcript_37692/g.65941 Transcript_37692/m.65941 type:complete len:97 (+) Transcript_37692:432-722(+)
MHILFLKPKGDMKVDGFKSKPCTEMLSLWAITGQIPDLAVSGCTYTRSQNFQVLAQKVINQRKSIIGQGLQLGRIDYSNVILIAAVTVMSLLCTVI